MKVSAVDEDTCASAHVQHRNAILVEDRLAVVVQADRCQTDAHHVLRVQVLAHARFIRRSHVDRVEERLVDANDRQLVGVTPQVGAYRVACLFVRHSRQVEHLDDSTVEHLVVCRELRLDLRELQDLVPAEAGLGLPRVDPILVPLLAIDTLHQVTPVLGDVLVAERAVQEGWRVRIGSRVDCHGRGIIPARSIPVVDLGMDDGTVVVQHSGGLATCPTHVRDVDRRALAQLGVSRRGRQGGQPVVELDALGKGGARCGLVGCILGRLGRALTLGGGPLFEAVQHVVEVLVVGRVVDSPTPLQRVALAGGVGSFDRISDEVDDRLSVITTQGSDDGRLGQIDRFEALRGGLRDGHAATREDRSDRHGGQYCGNTLHSVSFRGLISDGAERAPAPG